MHEARAFHDPWPLHRATLLDLDDSLVTAAGLPRPTGEPLVHYAPSVQVRIGWPARVSPAGVAPAGVEPPGGSAIAEDTPTR